MVLNAVGLVVAMIRRAWVLAILGVVLTTAATLQVWQTQGVYFGSADVVLSIPPSPEVPNSLGVTSGSLISTAGLLQREVMAGPDIAHVVSDGVTVLDEGIRNGVTVNLPNTGGQWADNFDQPVLHVQSVAPDASTALTNLTAMVTRIHVALEARQDAAGVTPDYRISATVVPSVVAVEYRTGERKRAAAMTVALGALVTLTLSAYLDRRRVAASDRLTGSTPSDEDLPREPDADLPSAITSAARVPGRVKELA